MALDDIVTAGIPEKDGCPIMTRIKAFIVDEGHCPTLEHVLRNRQGAALNLGIAEVSESGSESASESSAEQTIKLRVKEMIGTASGASKVHEIDGTLVDAENGVIRAPLNEEIVSRAGIYQLSWAYLEDGVIKQINDGLLSVERSLFGNLSESPKHITGPPTINEIRMNIMDSSGAENLLLDDVEFGDEQIALAVIKPIDHFNEVNPPLRTRYTTHTFVWKKHWLDAIAGYLMQFAAHNYRRNRLGVNAGGVSIDDQNKEREYLTASTMLLEEWKEFVKLKKYELNMAEAVGIIGSAYDV